MKFSLVLCTLDRIKEVGLFLDSLAKQHIDYELIIVDQNETNDLYEYFHNNYKYLVPKTKYIKTDKKGLSRSRNLGLKHVKGEFVCFPDDDCIYSSDLLDSIYKIFNSQDIQLLSIKSVGSGCLLINKDVIIKEKLTTFNLFSKAISYSLFFRKSAIDGISFDENLGVGAKFGSTEESDFVLSVMSNGNKCYYTDSLSVFHPDKITNYDNIERMSYYSLGVGAFFRKNLFNKSIGIYLQMLKAFLGPIFAIAFFKLKNNKKKKIWYKAMLKNRVIGFRQFYSNIND